MALDLFSMFTNSSINWSENTTMTLPNTTAFEEATGRWNSFNPPTFSLSITPASEEDVVTAVKIARSIDLDFLATGGRHSSAQTLGRLHDGLSIDLSDLDSVSVDAAAGTITVGGGTRFGQILDDVYAAGYQMPTGSCACPGMVGAAVGGGIGRYQGVNGLIIDSLLSVNMVTATGELIVVSNDSHPDLFWGVRGAAPNFGIITAATFQLHPLLNEGQFLSADFMLPASSSKTYFDMLETFQDGMPPELSTISIITYNATSEEPQIMVNWAYLGPQEDVQQYIDAILDLDPITTNISMVAYNEIIKYSLWGLGENICSEVSQKGYGVNWRNISSESYQEVFQQMADFYVQYPGAQGSSVEIEVFSPQAVETVASDATAYPWRDTKGYAGISFTWNSPETQAAGDAAAQSVRNTLASTSGYDDLAVYVSYAYGDETLEQKWGSNVPRLLQLKSQWDPDNVFGFWHAIPTNGTIA